MSNIRSPNRLNGGTPRIGTRASKKARRNEAARQARADREIKSERKQ